MIPLPVSQSDGEIAVFQKNLLYKMWCFVLFRNINPKRNGIQKAAFGEDVLRNGLVW